MKITTPALILIGSMFFMCSCVNIETQRVARLCPKGDRQSEATVYLEVSGFNTFPLTAEGPFPHWCNDLTIILNSDLDIPKTGKQKFSSGTDFSTRYNAIQSGTITIDRDRQRVDVKVKYTREYWWNRVNGRFPIEKGCDELSQPPPAPRTRSPNRQIEL